MILRWVISHCSDWVWMRMENKKGIIEVYIVKKTTKFDLQNFVVIFFHYCQLAYFFSLNRKIARPTDSQIWGEKSVMPFGILIFSQRMVLILF